MILIHEHNTNTDAPTLKKATCITCYAETIEKPLGMIYTGNIETLDMIYKKDNANVNMGR